MTHRQVTAQLEKPGLKIREHFKSGVYLPLIAELLGQTGLRLERWLEPR